MFRKIFFILLTFSLFLTACVPVGQIQVGIEPTKGGPEVVSNEETAVPSETPAPAVTEEPMPSTPSESPAEPETQPGTVSGKVCYPSERLPAMNAYFRNAVTGELTGLAIAENQSDYSIELPAGMYEAFAYLQDGELGGSYSQFVICGLSVDCFDHTLVAFEVAPLQETPNVDLCDWYEPLMVPVNPKATFAADPGLAGLVYQNLMANSLWRVNENGVAAPVLSDSNISTIISPDGTQALYFKNDDVWVGNLVSGAWRNLTKTPDRVEYPAAWVPGTDWVVMSSYGLAQDDSGNFIPPDALLWQLTFVRLDGTGYAVVDQGAMWGVPAASLKGDLVAYDVDGQARLYRLGAGVEGFDPMQYGLNGVEKISAPAFSPDGSKLAWWVGGSLNGGAWQNALAVFDLQTGTHTLLHPYTPLAGEGFSNPVWSPDGQWLATQVIGDGVRSALWAFSADGAQEINLGNGAYPVWSPVGAALLFILWPENGGPAWEATAMRVVLDGQSISAINLPTGGIPLGWATGQ